MQRLAMFGGLKGRITLLTFIPMLAVSIVASAAGVYSLWQLREARTLAALEAAAYRAEAMLRDAQASMGTYGVALSQQAAMVQAVANGDMPLIRTRITNSFEQLRASDPRVSVLEVTDARGRVLLRGHNPGLAGDDKSAVPDVARALRGDIAPGVTLSPTSGDLAYGTVVPLRLEGRVVGTLKVAGRMDATVARQMGRLVEGEVVLVGNGRVTASTVEGLDIGALAPVLAPDSRARTPEGDTLPLGRAGDHRLRVVPVTDVSGRQSGAMVIALPMAPWYAAQRAGIITTLLAVMIVLLVAQPIALIVARRIGQRLQAITAAMGDVAAGKLDAPIPDAGRRDEIGAMAHALSVFQDQARTKERLEAEAAAGRRAHERRSGAVQRYTEDFSTSMDGVMASFQQAAQRMQETAGAMTRAASLTREQVSGAAAESARTSENLTAVAAAVEELSATVGEISRQIASATTIAADAVREARASDGRMQALTGSAERIGEVIALISDVAGRTNLLALNATIEAARAGEAGKGFAVVASEVKALAAQTAKATEEIGTQIGAMRDATGEAAGAMRDIAEIITRMDEATAAIAAAVEQQGASTREITGRLQSVAVATSGVSDALRSVSETAEEAGRTGEEVQGAANHVESQAAQLGREVRGFLDNLASGSDERRRFERYDPAGRRAWLLHGGEAERVVIRDISLGGMALETGRLLPAGTPLRIAFGETRENGVEARVVRCEGGVIAVIFSDARGQGMVEELLRDMPLAA